MRTLAHLSDLHFGRTSARLVEAVLADVRALAPDLVVVSGDLTQRGRSAEYRAARSFLDRLPAPRLVVPGNHDIPLFDLARRFLSPLGRWRRHIGDELAPFHGDEELAVLGLNTARSLAWANGRVSHEQMALVRARLCGLAGSPFKVVVTHHPFLPPPGRPRAAVVGRVAQAMRVVQACGVDMILSGHRHRSGVDGTHRLYRVAEHSALVVQAGTATSVRTRAERNAYNAITVESGVVGVRVRLWDGEGFADAGAATYARVEGEWRPRGARARREVAGSEGAAAAHTMSRSQLP